MHRLRILDYIIFLLSLAVVTASVFWSASSGEGELIAEIEASGEVYIMPLSRDGSLVLKGPVGDTRVDVADGEVFISDSDCRDKICVAMGPVSTPSSWVACLPNRVFVRVVAGNSGKGTEVDAGAF
ncbi:MAG: NusG domain II-containing protein [Spirochaetaceae bacterium]|nr:NusG domain II-containing protein [Spirochaetaceae bacterium]RKX71996.1 MAG: hypothetical protein DRP49_09455 [Spirochaetota bacterium]RKX80648.1 MAG: hypothetical protein DRP60_02705 [Spirochaetota bacterium]RKX83515.1 MAG: hypothetical protein DRP70_14695 [Spirochaetota bacterium]RKX95371.1 MAG: hypothetical protein DRZ90_10395 [Spirochaetota bacterium]